MKQDESRSEILAEFRSWCAANNKQNPNGTDGFIFFGDLQQRRPDLLRFRYSGDKWQIVHAWLLQARLVSD